MAFNLKDDPRMQQRLQGAAGLNTRDIDAPAASLPPLDQIVVVLEPPQPPSETEILNRYRERLRDKAKVTARKPGDEIAFGDEVCVSTVGHVNGALLAGSIKSSWWIEMVPDASLPGFVEQLVGMVVGGANVIPVVVDDKRMGTMAVRIVAAQAIDMPNPESAAAVKAVGVAATLDATLEKLALDLLREAEDATPLRAMHAVMKKLCEVAKVDVPATAVDAEIQRAWRIAEGDACIALGMTVEEQQEALKLWLQSADVRAEATEKLKAWAALKAVALRDELTLTDAGWARFFNAMAPTMGQTPELLYREAEKDPKVKAELQELAFRMQVVDHVMAKVNVSVRGA